MTRQWRLASQPRVKHDRATARGLKCLGPAVLLPALQAAFQFGLKMADGRKSHKNLVNKANTKLKNELSSIKVGPSISCCSMHPDQDLLLSRS